MNEVKIYLPCGFDTTFGSLNNGEKVIRCMMCKKEDLNVEEILNKPGNRLRLKEKQLELETEKLEMLKEINSLFEKNPKFYLEQGFEQTLNEINLIREQVKIEFENKLENYFANLRMDLGDKNQRTIELIENCDHKQIDMTLTDDSDEKLKQIEIQLNIILEQIRKILLEITKIIFGGNFKFSFSSDQNLTKDLNVTFHFSNPSTIS